MAGNDRKLPVDHNGAGPVADIQRAGYLADMGKRSGVIDHEEGLVKLSLAELDNEIRRCETRLGIASSTQQKKQFERRIHWLESFRRRYHADE
ncbi:hypothetical protein [Sphingobium ummariense]